ncbi:MAG TPA: hypothetical protein VIL05_00525 [Thermoclostridium sp.]|jgi:hypothetical protein
MNKKERRASTKEFGRIIRSNFWDLEPLAQVFERFSYPLKSCAVG